MARRDIETRLRELGIYSNYYYRLELKALSMVMNPDETLNSVITGVMDGRRRLVAVTDYRVIIIAGGTLGAGEVTLIRRDSIKDWHFTKKFLLSSVEIKTSEQNFLIKQTQGGQQKLFTWAMEQPIKEFDE